MKENWIYYFQTIVGIVILSILFLTPDMEEKLGQFASGLIGLPLMLIGLGCLWNAWEEYWSKP